MKILITSDNHLGFAETDLIRGEDSFNTFEEILEIGGKEHVDLILQGGDLFHYNKPSRNTYTKTLNLLSKHCLGKKSELSLKPLSDSDFIFKANVELNRDNKGIDIKIPIISIHGNHDDPSGLNSVSPLNVLHSAGLINYVGKIKTVDDILIKPILIEKYNIKVALFPLGYIKDRRLYKAFNNGKVRFDRPVGNYYNILIVHQNRVFRDEEYLPEDFIPKWFDLAIYGHEHASVKVSGKEFDIIQVGSSVRTSLSMDERGRKYAYILEHLDKEWLIRRHPLKSVREFVMDSIIGTNESTEDVILRKLGQMIEKAREESMNSLLPLIRLKVELTGSKESLNKQIIADFLTNKVANVNDSVKITRKRSDKPKADVINNMESLSFNMILKSNISKETFKVLTKENLYNSFLDYTEKGNKHTFSQLYEKTKLDVISQVENMKHLRGEDLDDILMRIHRKD